MGKNRLKWHLIETFDYRYALVPSKKALARYQKKAQLEGMSHDSSLGMCYAIAGKDDRKPHSIVVISTDMDQRPLYEAISIIEHEAVHVFQNMCAAIGEDAPSAEFEAYSIQQIIRNLLFDYLTARRPDGVKALGFA